MSAIGGGSAVLERSLTREGTKQYAVSGGGGGSNGGGKGRGGGGGPSF